MVAPVRMAREHDRLTARVSVHRAFDASSIARGNGYFDRGKVAWTRRVSDHLLRAEVRGTWAYKLWIRFAPASGVLTLACDCPVIERYGTGCKHLWALLRTVDAKDLLPAARRANKLRVEVSDTEEFDELLDDDAALGDARAGDSGANAASKREGLGDHGDQNEFARDIALEPASEVSRSNVELGRAGREGTSARNGIAGPASAGTQQAGSSESRPLLDALIRRGSGYAEQLLGSSDAERGCRLAALLDPHIGPDDPIELTILIRNGNGYVNVSAIELLYSAVPGSVEADLALLGLRQAGVRPVAGIVGSVPALPVVPGAPCRIWLPRDGADGGPALLERLARAGSLLFADDTGSLQRLERWEPAALSVAIEADRETASYVLRGSLMSGAPDGATSSTEIDIGTVSFAHSSGALIARQHLMTLANPAQARWLVALREHGQHEVCLAPDELEDFLGRYYATPDLPEIRLPPGLDLEPCTTGPVRFVDVGASDGSSQGLPLAVGLRYHDKEVSILRDGEWVVDLTRNVRYPRDHAIEATMQGELEELGVRKVRLQAPLAVGGAKSLHEFRVARGRVPNLTATLVERGWSVSVEKKPHQKIASWHFKVSSGIDWLEITGSLQLEGQELPLGELLRALRRRKRSGAFVELSPGTTAVAPEAMLDQLERLLELGAGRQDDPAVRVSRSHAGAVLAVVDSAPSREEDAGFERLRHCLERGRMPGAESPPRGFRGTLRDYQREGLGWLRWLEQAGFGGCLADDMGLGKTIQVLALLLGRGRRNGPTLVVAPRSVLHNWADEASRFAPALRPQVHWGPERTKDAGALEAARLVVTTYALLARDIEILAAVDWDYLVLDEAQAIKNRTTRTASIVRRVPSRHRLALTGTPIENDLDELWSLLDFLNPGFGRRALAKGALSVPQRSLVTSLIKPFILRRTKRQVARDLPERIEQTLEVELSRSERRRYDELQRHVRRQYSDALQRFGFQQSRPALLTGLLRLRQAACHQGLIDDKLRQRPSSKLALLCERLEQLRQEGAKALVFSQFTQHLDLVEPQLERAGIQFVRLDGKTRRRQQCIEAFQDDAAITAFLISLKAGGTGLNLTAAEYVFLLDPWWNPAAEAQAIDRCHRIGQTSRVVAYRLISAGTVEEKVALLQQRKRDLVDSVFGDEKAFLGRLDHNDLAALLG